jgi:hypothetical protein
MHNPHCISDGPVENLKGISDERENAHAGSLFDGGALSGAAAIWAIRSRMRPSSAAAIRSPN